MRRWCGALAVVAGLEMVVCAGVAEAQSLAVRNATAGSTIELVVNTSTVGTAVADATGDVTLDVPPLSSTRSETTARVFVDRCADRIRVFIVDAVQTPAPGVCPRREVAGLFLVRNVTTLVMDVSRDTPAVRIRQGPAPDSWFRPAPPEGFAAASRVPAGFLLSATFGTLSLGSAIDDECGDVSSCRGSSRGNGYGAAATWWFTRVVGASAGFTRPTAVTLDGEGAGFEFDTRVHAERLVWAAAVIGVPAGRVRMYGRAGANHHRATTTTDQTISDSSVIIDGVEQMIPGGSQTLVRATSGFGWTFGGGAEVWLGSRFALFGEAGAHLLKGGEDNGGEARFDNRVPFVQFGGRFRIW